MGRKPVFGGALNSFRLVFLLATFSFLTGCIQSEHPAPGTETWRHDRLIYTKHARCRMDCRKIDEAEVREILERGRINNAKSEPAGRPDPKYAMEGKTRDNQEVRIVFAPTKKGVVVVTVIDLGTDWTCNCR